MLAEDYRYRAKVDSALDWYHGNVRQHAIILIWHVVGKSMKPNPMPISDGLAKRALAGLKVTLQVMLCPCCADCLALPHFPELSGIWLRHIRYHD